MKKAFDELKYSPRYDQGKNKWAIRNVSRNVQNWTSKRKKNQKGRVEYCSNVGQL